MCTYVSELTTVCVCVSVHIPCVYPGRDIRRKTEYEKKDAGRQRKPRGIVKKLEDNKIVQLYKGNDYDY